MGSSSRVLVDGSSGLERFLDWAPDAGYRRALQGKQRRAQEGGQTESLKVRLPFRSSSPLFCLASPASDQLPRLIECLHMSLRWILVGGHVERLPKR